MGIDHCSYHILLPIQGNLFNVHKDYSNNEIDLHLYYFIFLEMFT